MGSAVVETRVLLSANDGTMREVARQSKTISSLTKFMDIPFSIATGDTAILWNPTASGAITAPADFDFLYIETDGTLKIEFTVNEGHASENIDVKYVVAGVPLMLGDDTSYYNPGSIAGSTDVIDLIRANNASGSTVTGRLILAT
jgi:hypothetical protein